jgi:hypothetical protein
MFIVCTLRMLLLWFYCSLICNIFSNWWPLTSWQTLHGRSVFWSTLSRIPGELRMFWHAVRIPSTRPSSVSKGPYKRGYWIGLNGRSTDANFGTKQTFTVACSLPQIIPLWPRFISWKFVKPIQLRSAYIHCIPLKVWLIGYFFYLNPAISQCP